MSEKPSKVEVGQRWRCKSGSRSAFTVDQAPWEQDASDAHLLWDDGFTGMWPMSSLPRDFEFIGYAPGLGPQPPAEEELPLPNGWTFTNAEERERLRCSFPFDRGQQCLSQPCVVRSPEVGHRCADHVPRKQPAKTPATFDGRLTAGPLANILPAEKRAAPTSKHVIGVACPHPACKGRRHDSVVTALATEMGAVPVQTCTKPGCKAVPVAPARRCYLHRRYEPSWGAEPLSARLEERTPLQHRESVNLSAGGVWSTRGRK